MNASVRNRQTEAAECGLAALAMVASLAGSKIDLAWLRQRYPVSSRGLTLKDLMSVASGIGLSARAVRCEIEELHMLRENPILHWGLNHFVVLRKIGRARIVIYDPARGVRSLTHSEFSATFTGVALELCPTSAFPRRVERSPLKLSSLFSWNATVRAGLLQALLLSLVLQAYQLASPFLIQLAIDEAALKNDRALLTTLTIGFLLFAGFNMGAEVLRTFALQRVTSVLSWDMTQRLFHQLIRLPLPWFQRRRLADVLSRFQALEPLKALIANGLVATMLDASLAIGTAVVMAIYSPTLGAVTLACLVLYVLVRLVGLPFALRASSEALMAGIAEQGKRIEALRAIQTIKVMAAESQRESDWANKFADVVRTSNLSTLVASVFSITQRFIDTVCGILIVLLGVRSVMKGELTIGALYAFMAYRTQFMARISNVLEQAISWKMLDVYSFRLADVVHTPMEGRIDDDHSGLPDLLGAIQVRGAAFRYGPADPMVLKNVNLEIKAGEFVAIVGPSGTGKSTLMKALCGLYPLTMGSVSFDGVPISAYGLKELRRQIGVVMQDDELLSGSIAENVAFFDDAIALDRVWECLEMASIATEIRTFAMGVDTLVGDMGVALSGGQKQRVLLARALYKRPRVLLLDEATSHMDMTNERKIAEALAGLKITRIIVAHRAETIAAAERIIGLNEGVIVLDQRKADHDGQAPVSQDVAP